jgi:hypothetical protein
MNAYLKKITEETSIEINLQRMMGLDLCKINKHFLLFPIKVGHYLVNRLPHDKLIYHTNLFYFFPWYPNIHLGNTLLVNNTPYRTYLNPSFNAIFVEFYEYAPKEDSYLTKTFLPYLKFIHNSGLNAPTFVELYPFNAIRSIKEDDVRFRTLFEKCTMAYSTSFYKNCFTSIVSSPNILFYSFFAMFFWIFQSH